MTPQDAKTLEILTAIAEGKEWEYLQLMGDIEPPSWVPPRENTFINATKFVGFGHQIRLKPEVKMRPLRGDELNPVEVYREKIQSDKPAGYINCIFTDRSDIEDWIIARIENGANRTTDGGKTWQTFEVEDKS